MVRADRAGVEVVSLRRRAAASLIDGLVIVTPTVLASGGAVALVMWYRGRGAGSEDVDGRDESRFGRGLAAFRRFGESPRVGFAFEAALLPVDVRLRNWRSPGMRALGLRRADVRTGGPVTVRSALIHKAVQLAWRELTRRVQRPFDERFRERHARMKADLDEARRLHAGDLDAQQRAMTEMVRRYGVKPWPSCARGLLGAVPLYLPALWSERNQTLPDHVAGIVVVRDP